MAMTTTLFYGGGACQRVVCCFFSSIFLKSTAQTVNKCFVYQFEVCFIIKYFKPIAHDQFKSIFNNSIEVDCNVNNLVQ